MGEARRTAPSKAVDHLLWAVIYLVVTVLVIGAVSAFIFAFATACGVEWA